MQLSAPWFFAVSLLGAFPCLHCTAALIQATEDHLRKYAWIHFALGLVTFIGLQFITAPFGKHAKKTTVRLVVPAYASWIVQESPTLLSFLYFIAYEYPARQLGSPSAWAYTAELARCTSGGECKAGSPWGIGLLMFEACCQFRLGAVLFIVHYTHRVIIYPLVLFFNSNLRSPSAPQSGPTPVPVHVTAAAFFYCLFNGRLQLLANLALSGATSEEPSAQWTTWSATGCAGVVLFLWGMYVNVTSDYALVRLRNQKPRGAYKIPSGGYFEWVSCPNFLGEWVEWIGYSAVVCATTASIRSASLTTGASEVLRPSLRLLRSPPALAAVSFAAYVLANLLPRARMHHKWYLDHFGAEYRRLRRAAMLPALV